LRSYIYRLIYMGLKLVYFTYTHTQTLLSKKGRFFVYISTDILLYVLVNKIYKEIAKFYVTYVRKFIHYYILHRLMQKCNIKFSLLNIYVYVWRALFDKKYAIDQEY
jgi:hypothetical protein